METQRLLSPKPDVCNTNNSSEDEDEWSDGGSSYDSYCSGSDSTVPDWEPYIDDFTGELLYIDCHPFVTQHNKETKTKNIAEPFSKTQLRRSTRGKFLRLIRRRESKRKSKRSQKQVDLNETTTSKVKFQDCQEGEEKEVILEIDAENRHNLSSDKSLAESLLGLVTSTLSDGNRVMIAGFSYDSKAKNDRNIKIGDWLKSINNIEVNIQNLDDILQKFINNSDVFLKLVRVAGVDVTKEPPINELNLESTYVRELLNSKLEDEQLLMQTLCKYPAGVVYIDTEKLNENNKGFEDVIYCFPKLHNKNVLCSTRGMFITLNHLFNEITKSKPKTSSLKFKDRLCHVVYQSVERKLLLFMVPDDTASIAEVPIIQTEIVRFLQFSYNSIDKCFTTERYLPQVDHFFARFFTRVLTGGKSATVQQFLEMQTVSSSTHCQTSCHFEDIMPAVCTLSIPDEAQMQIDDALAELEASDYRDWNEEPLDCQRLFTILGSALYHNGYLLASHFIHEDLVDVNIFCKQQGIFHLSKTEPVKSLILWKEVFPYSCNRMPDAKVPDGRRYLLIVGSSKDILAVIMEAGGCTEPPEENMSPDAFYVEEVQATLAHIQEMGISDIAERWLTTNAGLQVASPLPPTTKRKNDFLNFTKPHSTSKEQPVSPKKCEVTSILKRRSSDQNFVAPHCSSTSSLQEDFYDGQSEGSGSQGGYSERSEVSDRSLKRDKCDSGGDDSEIEDYGDGRWSTSSFDISELRQSLLTETEDWKPLQLTAGAENVLYHFVQLDLTQGIILCPPDSIPKSKTHEVILDNFRRSCQKIYTIFQNTLRFKNMPAQEMAKSVMNKSLIAIKEYGIAFDCPYLDDKDKKGKISYWVIGRLFYMPHPREVYVCYHESVPQNMIEIAFKMNMETMS